MSTDNNWGSKQNDPPNNRKNKNDPPNPEGYHPRRSRPPRYTVSLPLPASLFDQPSLPYAVSLLMGPLTRTTKMLNGALMVASIGWEGRDKADHTMLLTKSAGLHFVRGLGRENPMTFVCHSWGCELRIKGNNINGNKSNVWSYPSWATGGTVKMTVTLTPGQHKRWKRRHAILKECSEKTNPPAALVRQTLELTSESAHFKALANLLTAQGEINAVRSFRATPTKVNITREGDIQSVVSRLPAALRAELLIAGSKVAEFDIKSAHAFLLGMFYDGEIGEGWQAEREQFTAEAIKGFPTIYGPNKSNKRRFLAALNQSVKVARHASAGYREFERLFPLLAAKVARIRSKNRKALGNVLRHRLAVIVRALVEQSHADDIPTIPVIDSAIVPMSTDLWEQHQNTFRTAWRLGVAIAEAAGAPPLIEGSNGENFRFFV